MTKSKWVIVGGKTFAKRRNQISISVQVILNPRKLVPTKLNESTLDVQ